MTHGAAGLGKPGRFAATHARRAWVLLLIAVALAGIAALLPGPFPSIVPLVAASTLATLGVALLALALRAWMGRRSLRRAAAALIENDAAPSFTTDSEGTIRHSNAAARERFEPGASATQ